jgi:ABC-type Fe3+/spermidine/putrescine transport system ATPase subunit
VLIRPEHVVLAPAGTGEPGPNRFHGTVSQTAFLGEAIETIVQVAGVNILVRSAAGPRDSAGPVELYFPPERTLVIAAGDA